MGRREAVAETLGIKWRGCPAWLLARTYHLAMMPGSKRKLRLLIDWNVGLLFGRDASELGQLGHPPPLGESGLHEQSAGGTTPTGEAQGGDEEPRGAAPGGHAARADR